eukprot:3706125-Pyramimonas_sp.AAC.1
MLIHVKKAGSFAQKERGCQNAGSPHERETSRGPSPRNGNFSEALFARASSVPTTGSAAP